MRHWAASEKDQMFDADLAATQNPHTPQAQLAEIAARRGDLHPFILSNPGCYPALREWIAQVNPAARPYSMGIPARPPARPRRSGLGCFFIGCGGMALLALMVVAVLVIGAIGSSNRSDPVAGPASEGSRAAFDAERIRYYELVAQLEGNPVAPLVTQIVKFERLETRIDDPNLTSARVAELAQEAKTARERLEQRIADAAARQTNASGSVSEALVDEAGAGFIDIAWDAGTECGTSRREGRVTIGCISEDPLAVHIAPENELSGDTAVRVTVLHELTHLYHRADSDAHRNETSTASRLVEQGYFQGSSEVMADCYALTYLNEWTLTFNDRTMGYGYVCNEEERAVIRQWAAEVHAPMP